MKTNTTDLNNVYYYDECDRSLKWNKE